MSTVKAAILGRQRPLLTAAIFASVFAALAATLFILIPRPYTARAIAVITPGNITVSGATGTGGAFKAGDTVTVKWDASAEGDGPANTDLITSVTMDLEDWGGLATEVPSATDCGTLNDAGDCEYTATYVLQATDDIETASAIASVTADAEGSTTVPDDAPYTVDSNLLEVTTPNIDALTVKNVPYVASRIEFDPYTHTGAAQHVSFLSNSGFGVRDEGMSGAIPLPFAFTFFHDSYNEVYVNTNGFINFVGDDCGSEGGGDDCYVTQSIPDSNTPNNAIYGYWQDFTCVPEDGDDETCEGSVRHETFGLAPNRVFVVSFDDIQGQTFQFHLHETSNDIALHTTSATELTATQGIEDAGGDYGLTLPGRNLRDNLRLVEDGVLFEYDGNSTDFRAGDTVAARWDDSFLSGDNNGDTESATVDLSAWGGLVDESMTQDELPCRDGEGGDDVWDICFNIAGDTGIGEIFEGGGSLTVTATDDAGNETTSEGDGSFTIDREMPDVTPGNIFVEGAGGIEGAFIIGDTVTIAWDDSETGDDNADEVFALADLQDWGGSTATVMTSEGGIYTASFTIVPGNIDQTEGGTTVSATDDAGNVTTESPVDSGTFSIDNVAPTVTAGEITVTGATGSRFNDFDTVTVLWHGYGVDGDNNDQGEVPFANVTVDLSPWGGNAATVMGDVDCGDAAEDGVLAACVGVNLEGGTATNVRAEVTATDNAGNVTATNDDQAFAINTNPPSGGNQPPTVTVSAPNGGETFAGGSTTNIFWGSGGDGGQIQSMRLSLSMDAGVSWSVIASGEANDGVYSWSVPSAATTQARVKVEALGTGGAVLVSDTSDNNFTITVPTSGGGGGGGGGSTPPPPPPSPSPAPPPTSGSTIPNDDGSANTGSDAITTSAAGDEAMPRSEANAMLPPAYPVDSLVKLPNDGDPTTFGDETVYYIGLDAKRHPFMNATSFLTWYADFSMVKMIDSATLASIPLDEPIMVRPGTKWVKITSDPKTYWVEPGNVLRHIDSEETAVALWGPTWNQNIVDVDVSLFLQFETGAPIRKTDLDAGHWPRAALVSATTDAIVWYITSDSRRSLGESSSTGFTANYFQARFVSETDGGWRSMPVGSSINGFEEGLFSLQH